MPAITVEYVTVTPGQRIAARNALDHGAVLMAGKDQSTLFPIRDDHNRNGIIGCALKTCRGWRIFDAVQAATF